MNALVVAAIVGLCQAIKLAGVSSRYIPLVAVVLGVGSVFLLKEETLLIGILEGLSAVGLYSGVKASVGK